MYSLFFTSFTLPLDGTKQIYEITRNRHDLYCKRQSILFWIYSISSWILLIRYEIRLPPLPPLYHVLVVGTQIGWKTWVCLFNFKSKKLNGVCGATSQDEDDDEVVELVAVVGETFEAVLDEKDKEQNQAFREFQMDFVLLYTFNRNFLIVFWSCSCVTMFDGFSLWYTGQWF